jgi:hypothetical protein
VILEGSVVYVNPNNDNGSVLQTTARNDPEGRSSVSQVSRFRFLETGVITSRRLRPLLGIGARTLFSLGGSVAIDCATEQLMPLVKSTSNGF